jgi:hypothetical protein
MVNGAYGTLIDIQRRGVCIALHQAHRVWLHKRYCWLETPERRPYLTSAYDLELGWCTTLHKVEGMTLGKGVLLVNQEYCCY